MDSQRLSELLRKADQDTLNEGEFAELERLLDLSAKEAVRLVRERCLRQTAPARLRGKIFSDLGLGHSSRASSKAAVRKR